MGHLAHSITTTLADWSPQQQSWDISEGILYAINAQIYSGTLSPNAGWIEVAILDTVDSFANNTNTLISGPIGNLGPICWTGRQPVVTEDRIGVRISAPTGTTVSIAWLQLMPSADLNAKQTLDA